MNKLDLNIFIVQLLIIIIIFILLVYYLRFSRLLKNKKRIEKFTLKSIKDEEVSLLDNLNIKLWIFVKGISKCFSKSVFLTNYGKKFDKYIDYEEREIKKGIDYVSIKFLLGFSLVLLNIFSYLLKFISFNVMSLLITFLIGFFVIDIFASLQYKYKRKRVEEDLLKSIIIMNNAFKSGRNIIQAIEFVKNELNGPIQDEFKKIYMDLNYGLSLEVVFNRFYERVGVEDAKYITSSLTLLNKTGGNIVKVFSSIERNFYDKKKLRDELKSMTASSVFVFRLLVIMPPVLSIALFVLNPTYFNPLIQSKIGILMLFIILSIYSIYILVVRKVMKVSI